MNIFICLFVLLVFGFSVRVFHFLISMLSSVAKNPDPPNIENTGIDSLFVWAQSLTRLMLNADLHISKSTVALECFLNTSTANCIYISRVSADICIALLEASESSALCLMKRNTNIIDGTSLCDQIIVMNLFSPSDTSQYQVFQNVLHHAISPFFSLQPDQLAGIPLY